MARTLVVKAPPNFRFIATDASRVNEVLSRVYAKQGVRTLGKLRKAFSLNRTETGRLFKVSPEAVAKWETNGVPLARLAEIDRCWQLAELMQRRLRPDRLPALVRKPSPDLKNRNVLQVIAEDGTAAVSNYMRALASGIPRR